MQRFGVAIPIKPHSARKLLRDPRSWESRCDPSLRETSRYTFQGQFPVPSTAGNHGYSVLLGSPFVFLILEALLDQRGGWFESRDGGLLPFFFKVSFLNDKWLYDFRCTTISDTHFFKLSCLLESGVELNSFYHYC